MKIRKELNLPNIYNKLSQLGLNQAQVAEKLGVSREAVSKWFKSENLPSAGKLLKLSKLLELTFDSIVNLEFINQPLVDFRKNGSATTSEDDRDFALGMGNALESMVPHFPLNFTNKPPVLQKPHNDYFYIIDIVNKIRSEMNFTKDILKFKDLVSIFNKYNSIIIPVLWDGNRRHANALRIYLPDSMTTWIYLNLNTNLYDFKFWMTHELGHVLAPDLKGDEAELFADNFAGSLLFPFNETEKLYEVVSKEKSERKQIDLIINKAKELLISPLSVYLQLIQYATNHQKQTIDLKHLIYKFNSKFKTYFPTLAYKIFGKEHPDAKKYIKYVNENFDPPFFIYLKKYLDNRSASPTFIQNLLDISFLDAQNIYHAL